MILKNNIPQGYKQTEFGPIPLDWELCTFKDVLATFSSGATPYRGIPEYYNGDVRWISSGELNYNHIYDTLEHISQQAVRTTNLRIHKPDTFLMAITGLEAEGTRGRCAFVGAPSTTNQSCLAINGTDKMCTEYLFWFYRMWGKYLAFKYCQGTKQQSYTADIVKKLPIYGPKNIAEQRAIAEALSDVDGLIAALDKKIAKKRLLKQGAMQQLLTGKKRLPGFTDEWVDRSLSQLGSFISGNGFPIYFQGNKSGKYPFFKVSDFNNRGNERCLMHSNNYISESTKERLNCNIVPASSVIFAKIGAAIFLERKRLSTKECCIDNNMMAFSPNEYIDANYICFLLQTISFGELVEATALPSLGAKILGSIILKAPNTLNEQQAIATILSDMDKEIADLEAQRDKYRLLKSGMMQKLLTGQIRLKTE